MTDVQKIKKTKRPLVPRLRFPEFKGKDDWQAPRLGDIAVPVEERVGDRNLTALSISAGTGFVPQSEKFGRNISGGQYRSYTVVHDGDFVYNKGNSIRFPQGCIYDLQGWGEAAVPNVFICFRLTGDGKNKFFRQLFENNAHGVQLKKYITSGARSNGLLNVNKKTFFSIKIPVPGYVEQQKIAECLSSLDELIAAEVQKLEALNVYKIGLMQQVFPSEGEVVPRLRFSGFVNAEAWGNVVAGELFSNRVERGRLDVPVYSVTMDEGLVVRASLDRRIDDVASSSANKMAYKGDLVYNMMRMWQGAVGIAMQDCMVSPAYVVLEPSDRADSLFFYFFLKRSSSLRILSAHSKGLTKDRLRIYYEDFSKLSLPCPLISEQSMVADVLLSVDNLILNHGKKIEALRDHKKGLLQRLFPVMNGEGCA